MIYEHPGQDQRSTASSRRHLPAGWLDLGELVISP
jgi:hypothetical protein